MFKSNQPFANRFAFVEPHKSVCMTYFVIWCRISPPYLSGGCQYVHLTLTLTLYMIHSYRRMHPSPCGQCSHQPWAKSFMHLQCFVILCTILPAIHWSRRPWANSLCIWIARMQCFVTLMHKNFTGLRRINISTQPSPWIASEILPWFVQIDNIFV